MNPLRTFWREWKLAYFEWAIRSIDPLHEDVPYIVQQINQLKAERMTNV